jgi:2-polyprenyl-3-methyl-5-hydroxy-6-metoxy-1,4-benzoquinol methylase
MTSEGIPPTVGEQNAYVRNAWDTNAAFWDERMGEGNTFFHVLISPAVDELLQVAAGARVLELACGNGVYARHLAERGVNVLATDFAPSMIELARVRSRAYSGRIDYRIVDATDEAQLRALAGPFDAIVCIMGLMDMAAMEPLARTGRELLAPGAPFVFSVIHPCFNSSATNLVVEEEEDAAGRMVRRSWLRVRGYKRTGVTRGEAMHGQPLPHLYFNRPLEELLGVFFGAGWVLDGLREPAFEPGSTAEVREGPNWINLPDIPPVLVARLRAR